MEEAPMIAPRRAGIRGLFARVLSSPDEPWRSVGLGLLRAYVGAAILLAHALPKMGELLRGDGHFAVLVASMGFPAPGVFAWFAAITQVVGSVALILGVATRLAAVAVTSTLAVGMLGVHLGDPFPVVEGGVAYVVAMLVIAIVGPGDFAVDRLVRQRLLRVPMTHGEPT